MAEEIEWRTAYDLSPDTGVQIAFLALGVVAIRSAERPHDVLYFPRERWDEFVDGVASGEFDPPPSTPR
jgi:hypothetical protein